MPKQHCCLQSHVCLLRCLFFMQEEILYFSTDGYGGEYMQSKFMRFNGCLTYCFSSLARVTNDGQMCITVQLIKGGVKAILFNPFDSLLYDDNSSCIGETKLVLPDGHNYYI